MKFRDDIDPANTWIVSDTHFGHDNIVGFCHRPEDHEQVMIAEWRKEVPDDATVIHLGDLCYKGNARFKNLTAKELTGARKLLVLGNHDRQRYSFYRDCGFQPVKPFAIDFNGYPISFAHYPWSSEDPLPGEIAVLRESDPPSKVRMLGRHLRLHGHIHNNGYSRDAYVPFIRNHINLSVEQTKYKPVNLKLLLDAYLLGDYPETTPEQLEDARARKEANRA